MMFSRTFKVNDFNNRKNKKNHVMGLNHITLDNNNEPSIQNVSQKENKVELCDKNLNSESTSDKINNESHKTQSNLDCPRLSASNDSLDKYDKAFNTVLRIDEDDQISMDFKSDEESKTDSKKDGSTGSTASMYEDEDTLSLINETNLDIQRRDSKHSNYDDYKRHGSFIDAVERRLSLTQDVSEKIVHKLLDSHLEKYEEIPDKELEDNEQEFKKYHRVVKNGEVLSTANNISCRKKNRCCCGPKAALFWGIFCFTVGLLTTIWTPSEFLMNERLKMTPGLPAFDWWADPPDDIYLRVYLFNYTNSDKFLSGEDNQLNLVEVGPIVFKEKVRHSNFTFNENSTLTYNAHRWVEFLPDMNTHIDMNASITVPNMPVLGFASYLHEHNIFIKKGFQFMLRVQKSKIFVNITVYDYLFNFQDTLLKTGSNLLPQIVPVSNMGMLETMYMQPVDTVTVFIGSKWGDEKFFTIDKYDGHSELPGYLHIPSCKESVNGSTEGMLYRQRITKDTKLLYWRKTLCRPMALYYESEEVRNGIVAYRFAIPENAYHRTYNHSNPDCFSGEPTLRNGLSDISKCFFDFPMALSLPHFLGTDPESTIKIRGLKPNRSLHNSYLILEPMAGIPMVSVARSQINLVVRNLSGFTRDIERFNDIALPMFWAEYSQLVLPNYVWNLMIVQLKYIPVIQVILSVLLIILGLYLMSNLFKKVIYPICCPKSFRKHKNLNNLARSALMTYEVDKKISNNTKS